MKSKYFIFFISISLLLGIIIYRIQSNSNKNDKNKDKGNKEKSISVTGLVVSPEKFENSLNLSGTIEANEQIEIRSEVSGIVENIYFQEGTIAKKGQILFKVKDNELKAQLLQSTTKGNLAAENARRAKLLLEKEAISQEEYEIAKTEHKTALAQIQLIQAQIEKTTVRAPFSGKIGLRSISVGTYITPATLIAKLVNTEKLKITFSIPEKYSSQVQNNTSIYFNVSGSSEKYRAVIYAIEPEIATQTRTLQVRAITENKSGKLFPGTFANVTLPLAVINDAILIPSEAIVPIQNGKKVFISINGKAKEIKVETQNRTESEIVVLSGLNIGDTLITSGVMALKDETPVHVQIKTKK